MEIFHCQNEQQLESEVENQAVKLPSSCREMRIKAEKERRDRLKKSTDILATLVPSVMRAPKRPDKTSILRLSANYITLHRCFKSNLREAKTPYTKVIDWFLDSGIEKMYNMFFITLFTDGKILYVSDRVEKILGHPQVDLLNEYIYRIIPKQEYPLVQRELIPSYGSSRKKKFFCHMIERGFSKCDPGRMVRVLVQGQILKLDTPQKRRNYHIHGNFSDKNDFHHYFFVGVVSPSPERPLSKINLLQATKDEYLTRHLLDGRIVEADHRISMVAGYFTTDVIGNWALDYMTPDDKMWIGISLKNMVSSGDQVGVVTYKLITAAQTVIYLRTQGYVQIPRASSDVPTMVCINSLIDQEIGENEIREQRKKFETLFRTTKARAQLAMMKKFSYSGDHFGWNHQNLRANDCSAFSQDIPNCNQSPSDSWRIHDVVPSHDVTSNQDVHGTYSYKLEQRRITPEHFPSPNYVPNNTSLVNNDTSSVNYGTSLVDCNSTNVMSWTSLEQAKNNSTYYTPYFDAAKRDAFLETAYVSSSNLTQETI